MTDCRRCAADRTNRRSRTKTENLPGLRLLETGMPVFGRLPVLQPLQHAPPRCVGAFAIKLVPITKSARVQLIGCIRVSSTIDQRLAWRFADSGRVGQLPEGSRRATQTGSRSLQPLTAAVRQNLALDLADQFGDVVGEVEVMAGENPHGEL
jgi:hypothetical protein